MRIATGVDLFDRSWARNNGNHFLYFSPPYSDCPNFGDASYNRPKGLHRQIMATYAWAYRNPYYLWYAEQCDQWYADYDKATGGRSRKEHPARQLYDYRNGAYLLSLFLHTDAMSGQARPPTDLPQAIHLRDIGWVAMHSDLANGDRNIMLQFKSSPYGSFNHSHADQNSFVLEAFSHPLLINSGYYPSYGHPHDVKWTRQTRAHNALLVNGKGQGVWNRDAAGQIIAFATNADFDYTAGTAAAAYRNPSRKNAAPELCAVDEGIVSMVRHVVFVRPNAFVILDEVETEQPASIQFPLHAVNQFEIDEERRIVSIVHDSARARIHLLERGPVAFSQTDKFSDPCPADRMNRPAVPPDHFDQWHLTADFAATDTTRRLLTVILVGRSDDEAPPPEIERLSEPGMLGARIGSATVKFRLNMPSVAVSCRGVREDGTIKWLEYTGSPR